VLRVLHVLPTLDPGGAERLVVEHARRSENVAVITVFGGGPLASRLPSSSALPLGERRPGRPSTRAFARMVAAARAADVVHTHLFAGDLWGGLAARLTGRPQVSHEHNVDRDEAAHVRTARRVIARWPALTLAVSEAAARHSFAAEVRVVPNGVDLARFTRPWRGGGGVIALGRRVPQKGFDVLAAALPPGVQARLFGAGDPPFAHPQVHWEPPTEAVPELLAGADVLVVPSRWEGFGLVALEGLAAGVPVIASAVDGLADLLGDAAILVPPDDPNALRAALLRVLGDDALRHDLSRRGRERAARYPLDETFSAWSAAYVAVTAPTGG